MQVEDDRTLGPQGGDEYSGILRAKFAQGGECSEYASSAHNPPIGPMT